MKFVELSEKEFIKFSNTSSKQNYVQSVGMGKLKKQEGHQVWYVGIKEKNIVLAATMMYAIPTFMHKFIFYAPRGFLIDYHDILLLTFFTKEIKKFVNSLGGIKIIIDPKEIYQLMDADGNSISEKNDETIENLRKCGYKHFGFNKNFETIQVRYNAIVPIMGCYEDMLQTFSKTTKKHLISVENGPLRVRRGDYDDLSIMEKLLTHTAENKHFEHKSLKHYQKMYKIMSEIMNIYIASIDFEEEKKLLEEQLSCFENEKKQLEEQMKKINIGKRILQKQELLEMRIDKVKAKLEDNAKNNKKYGKKIDIASLLSIESGDEYISLFSGMLEEFREYSPKYALYNMHIKDAIQKQKKIVNFYGISGDLRPQNELYKIYELKKGFNGQIVELVGQFDLPINFWYYIYEVISKIKRIIK